MTPGELHTLATRAMVLLRKKHGVLLLGHESLQLRFSEYRGARRIELSLENNQRGTRMDFFVDVPYLDDEEESIYLGLDFLDGVLEEHLESGRETFPRLDPAPYHYDGHTLYLSGQYVKPALDAEADAILAAAGFFDESQAEPWEESSEPLPVQR